MSSYEPGSPMPLIPDINSRSSNFSLKDYIQRLNSTRGGAQQMIPYDPNKSASENEAIANRIGYNENDQRIGNTPFGGVRRPPSQSPFYRPPPPRNPFQGMFSGYSPVRPQINPFSSMLGLGSGPNLFSVIGP